MLTRGLAMSAVVLGMSVACGGGEDRQFASGTGGAAGSSGSGGATGGSSGSGATGGDSGGTAGSGTGGSSATGGSAGAGGASGGAGGATGGAGGATGGAGGSGGATGGSGGGSTCNGSTHTCAPDAPAGWTGPVAFRHGAGAPPACPGAYPTKASDGHVGLNPGTATCNCSCDPATGITGCNGTASIYDVPNTAVGCAVIPTGYTKVWTAAAGQCVKPTANSLGNVALVPPTPASNGTCAPKANNTLPTPTWGQDTRICAGATASSDSCNTGQTCMPKAFAPYELCIYRPGNGACPSAGYTQKLLVYESFQDTRACSACACGNASSGCKGSVTFASACSGTPIAYGTVSSCGTPTSDIATTQYGEYSPQPSGSCPASTPTLTGSVTTGGEATVCCLP